MNGMTVPGSFDSLIAKIIINGANRKQALQRLRRALKELVIEGMLTVVPFHLAVLDDPAFTAEDGRFGVHHCWIETSQRTDCTVRGPARRGCGVNAAPVVVEVNGSDWKFCYQPASALPMDPRPVCAPRSRSKCRASDQESVGEYLLTSPMQHRQGCGRRW